ncbi:hypothetical protein MASR2M66_09960 [Chloroflexota bacterium]
MTEEPIKEDPVEKFRKLIASFIPLSRLSRKNITESATEKPEVEMNEKKDAFSSLPKKPTANGGQLASLPKKADAPQPAAQEKPAASPKLNLAALIPKAKKPAVDERAASTPDLKPESAPQGAYPAWGPRLWTTASVLTLAINFIVMIILIILLISVYRMRLNMTKIMELGPSVVNLPGGLYENFEKMERANIETNVVVETSIPVKFDLQLNQQTNVVLSQDVTITNALVTVNTGGLNISRANTTIVLPQGTVLPVVLNLTVPVDQQVPVVLNVPVNIPLKDTQLREPFVGLQEVMKPLYCFLTPGALNMDGQPVCP